MRRPGRAASGNRPACEEHNRSHTDPCAHLYHRSVSSTDCVYTHCLDDQLQHEKGNIFDSWHACSDDGNMDQTSIAGEGVGMFLIDVQKKSTHVRTLQTCDFM